MKKRQRIIIIGAIVIALLAAYVIISSKVRIITVSNANFRVSYDTTWRVKDKKDQLYLVHKKTKSELKIQCKVLEDNYIDTNLSDLIDDIIFGIEEQNEDYVLINREESNSVYSFLYENNDKQVLVRIIKKDNKVIIAYYEAESKYYDIVLDSVEIILDSLEIVFED